MEDEKKAGPGRPEVGGRTEVLLGNELKARVTEWAARNDVRLKGGDVNRNEAVRRLTTIGLERERPVERTAGIMNLTELKENLTVIAEELDDGGAVGVEVYSDGRGFWVACVEKGEVEAYTTNPAAAGAALAASLRAYEEVRDEETGDVLHPSLVAAAHRLHSDPVATERQLTKSLHDNLVSTPYRRF